MVDAWPLSLPQQILVDGYAQAIGDGRLVAKPDAGPPLVRRRSSATVQPLAGQLPPLTKTQLDALRVFVDVTLLGGSLPFSFPDPLDLEGDPLLVMFADDGLPDWNARRRDKYLVSLKLWVMP